MTKAVTQKMRETKKTVIVAKEANKYFQIEMITPTTVEETNFHQSYTCNIKAATV